MTGTLIVLLLVGLLIALWSGARDAHERARQLAARACQRSGVQLLDQTVSLDHIGLGRSADGRLRISRRYRFDYSQRGSDRRRAALAMLGNELLWLQNPEPRDELDFE
ncbi:MAG: DUF3301 domain-containing protein [Xanthomonadales bacterium]|nr:DUF3301 domain-containing protein [Xanthomonadales bacterium]